MRHITAMAAFHIERRDHNGDDRSFCRVYAGMSDGSFWLRDSDDNEWVRLEAPPEEAPNASR